MYTTTQSTAQSTATQEDTVAVIWLFLDKLQPHENARCIYIPRDLFERRSEDCQQLFATELKKKFYFDADVESIEFWMPRDHLSVDAVVEKGWTDRTEDKLFKKISFTRRLVDSLTSLDNEDIVHLIVTASGSYMKRQRSPQVVDPSVDATSPSLNKRRRTSHPGVIEMWKNRTLPSGLPTYPHDLEAFLREPLHDSEKLPVRQSQLDDMISEYSDPCTDQDVGCIFTLSDGPFSRFIDSHFVRAVLMAPSGENTENTHINFWDGNIRELLEILIPEATSRRDTNKFTENGNSRPDYTLIMNNKCPFRGEEKPPGSVENVKAELVEKLVGWKYDPAPYILGYYAVGSSVTYVAILKDDRPGAKPFAVDLVKKDLRLRKNRVENIGIILKLAVVIRALEGVMGPASVDEYTAIYRPNCRIDLSPNTVHKIYTCPDAFARGEHLKNIYNLLDTKKVPNTDRLLHVSGATIALTPRGVEREPANDEELRNAIACVLETLKVAHQGPKSLYHRDIRWNNVLRKIEDPARWFLIDWEDSSVAPTKAAPLLKNETHSPDVFKDNHGAEVDIWGIGFLILSCRSLIISDDLKKFGRELRNSSHNLSAEDVLEQLQQIK